jgi:hypothetical protein
VGDIQSSGFGSTYARCQSECRDWQHWPAHRWYVCPSLCRLMLDSLCVCACVTAWAYQPNQAPGFSNGTPLYLFGICSALYMIPHTSASGHYVNFGLLLFAGICNLIARWLLVSGYGSRRVRRGRNSKSAPTVVNKVPVGTAGPLPTGVDTIPSEKARYGIEESYLAL